MAPSGSKLIGNSTIWDKSGEPVDGFDTLVFATSMYPIDVFENITSGATLPSEFSLEGPPDFTELVATAALLGDIKLEPVPGYSDTITSSSLVQAIRLITPEQYGPESVRSGALVRQITLEPEDAPEPPPIINYTRWPIENVESGALLDTEEVKLYEPE